MNFFNAFWVGGLVCVAAQLLIDYTKLTPARILTGCVVLGVILAGIGVFKPLSDFAGAGVTVPLLGFGNTMAEGVREAVNKDGLIGVLTGGLEAGAAGISAAVFFSLLAALVGKSRMKK